MNINEIEKIIPKEKILQNVQMKKYTSFKIGGEAEVLIKISTLEELTKIIKYINQKNIQTFILGNGSNLLISDEGIRGIVLKIEIKKLEIEEINNKFKITVGAGVKLGELAQKLANKEISGFEFASGIPGTIGGAIRMNAGAHGSEMKDIVKTVTYMDRNTEIHKITNEQAEHHPQKNMLMKALGCNAFVEPDVMVKGFLKDDILIMCSDGLSNLVEQDTIYEMASKNIEQATKDLVQLANDRGGYDNITVIVIKNI